MEKLINNTLEKLEDELEGWIEMQLDEFADINPTTKLAKGTIAKKVPMDTVKPYTKSIPSYELKSYSGGVKFINEDILMARITPSLENGKTSFVDFLGDEEVGFGSTEFIVLRAKEGISDPEYLYYLSISPELREVAIQSMTGSSGRQRVQNDVVKEFKFLFPLLSEQKAIANLLSSLDNKIDLLHRQNKTIETMAETLFRHWFVEKADESWEVLPLSDIAEVKNGYSFSSSSYIEFSPNSLEVFKMGHIEKGGGLRSNPKKNYVPRSERLERFILDKNDIVMAMTDMKDNVVILGVPAMVDKSNHYILNQRVARIYLKSKAKLLSQYFLYIQLNDNDNIASLQSKANSGVQVNLSTQTIRDIEIIIPPMEIQKQKGQAIIDLFEKKNKNSFQVKTLEKLRDTLLPKLMSGEVRVKI